MPSKIQFNTLMQHLKAHYMAIDRKERHHLLLASELENYIASMEKELLLYQLFPGGKIAAAEHLSNETAVVRTRDFIASGEELIYNALFHCQNEYKKIPLIKKVNNQWEIYDTNKVYNRNEYDEIKKILGAYQVSHIYYIGLNPNYTRNGILDLESLFYFKEVDFQLNFCEVSQKKEQKIQKLSLESIYPAIALDINTYATIWPQFDDSRPYQLIPFQFSLAKKYCAEDSPVVYNYIGNGIDDPREALIQNLIQECGEQQPILVSTIQIEMEIVEELARDFPQYRDQLKNILDRMIDMNFIIETYLFEDTIINTPFDKIGTSILPPPLFQELPQSHGMTLQEFYKSLMYVLDSTKRQQRTDHINAFCSAPTVELLERYLFSIHYYLSENVHKH